MVIRSTPSRSRKDDARLAARRELRQRDADYNRIRDLKQAPVEAPARRHLSEEQYEALTRRWDPQVEKVIRKGHRKPRTWDEINSTYGGGRDFGRLT